MRMRMRRPSRRKPTGTSQRLGLTRAELQKQRPTATPASPTAAQKTKLVAALKAAKAKARPTGTPKKVPMVAATAMPSRRKPTGTPKPTGGIRGATQAQLRQIRQRQQRKPTGRQPTAAEKTMLEEAFKKQNSLRKPPTSQQRAAMRKQRIARSGNNTAQRIRTQDAELRRLLRQGKASPGQVRSVKMARQRPRRRPTGTPKRRRII